MFENISEMTTVGSLEAVKEGDENEEDETEEEEVKERHSGDFEEEATGGNVVVEEKKNRCFANMLFFIGPRCPWGPIYGSGCLYVTHTPFADLTDVTLVDEDTKSILTDNANPRQCGNACDSSRQPGGQIFNQCK